MSGGEAKSGSKAGKFGSGNVGSARSGRLGTPTHLVEKGFRGNHVRNVVGRDAVNEAVHQATLERALRIKHTSDERLMCPRCGHTGYGMGGWRNEDGTCRGAKACAKRRLELSQVERDYIAELTGATDVQP